MKKSVLLMLFMLTFLAFTMNAQEFAEEFPEYKAKAFNWGGKLGLNAASPVINSIKISNIKATDISTEYKVGRLASIFCRFNGKKIFIQPSIEWQYSAGDINFTLLQTTVVPATEAGKDATTSTVSVKHAATFKTNSLELPVLFGFYLFKEGPYALSIFTGPKMQYNYNVRYITDINNTSEKYTSDSTPFGVNIALGSSVSIWRLFFDFTYEFGVNEIQSDFSQVNTNTKVDDNISINKRTNLMTFSLGFLF